MTPRVDPFSEKVQNTQGNPSSRCRDLIQLLHTAVSTPTSTEKNVYQRQFSHSRLSLQTRHEDIAGSLRTRSRRVIPAIWTRVYTTVLSHLLILSEYLPTADESTLIFGRKRNGTG